MEPTLREQILDQFEQVQTYVAQLESANRTLIIENQSLRDEIRDLVMAIAFLKENAVTYNKKIEL